MVESRYPKRGAVLSADGATVSVPLTQGQTTILDAADFPLIAPYTWWAQKTPEGFYAVTKVKGPDGKRRSIQMQRIIMGQPESAVDHADGDRLNNRRANLRPATDSQNKANSARYRNNTSGFKGVYWKSSHKQWEAQIHHQKRLIWLGYHRTPEAAARAYDAKAREIYGPFARCNFPADSESSH